MIDLHLHSSYSIDAKDAPAAIVEAAIAKGLRAIALTDHSAVAGIPECRDRAVEAGLEYITGIEVGSSVKIGRQRYEIHLLGYFFDPRSREIRAYCAAAKKKARLQAEAFLAGLRRMRIPITRRQVKAEYPGRFSSWALRRMLREKGFAAGKPESAEIERRAVALAAVENPKFRVNAESQANEPMNAIKLLRSADASIYLAHPFWLTLPQRGGHPPELMWRLIKKMLAFGIDGLEAYNTANPDMAEELLAFCRKRRLAACGGTDSHGRAGVGSLPIGYEILESMKRRRAGLPPWNSSR